MKIIGSRMMSVSVTAAITDMNLRPQDCMLKSLRLINRHTIRIMKLSFIRVIKEPQKSDL